jgi:hypothetical protein
MGRRKGNDEYNDGHVLERPVCAVLRVDRERDPYRREESARDPKIAAVGNHWGAPEQCPDFMVVQRSKISAYHQGCSSLAASGWRNQQLFARDRERVTVGSIEFKL